jgi:DNA-binding transcriptional ArsR family regulator
VTSTRTRAPRTKKTPQAEHPVELTAEQVSAAVMSFALLADPTRVRMLWALRDTELDVTSLATLAECRPTVASQHLSKLRFAGLVEGQRQGQRVVYRLRGGHVRALLGEALFHADHQISGAPSTTSAPRPQSPTRWR